MFIQDNSGGGDLFEKDVSEALGFTDGNQFWEDVKEGNGGMLSVLVSLHIYEQID